MELSFLTLTNYRNFASLELELPSGLVVLAGENAQGKSNILEAVHLLAIGRSYRATTERELVAWNVSAEGGYAIVGAKVRLEEDQLEIRLGLECNGATSPEAAVRKRVLVNGAPRRPSELVGLLNAVLFSASDIDMVYGPPALRRRYLDVMLCQVSRPYFQALQRYQRVLPQRNTLLRALKEGRAREHQLEVWDEALCTEGAVLLEARSQALTHLAPSVQRTYEDLTGQDEQLRVEYASTTPCSEPSTRRFQQAIAQALQESRAQERAMAQTVVGPHRDDLRLTINGMEMARYASRGQARLMALALRLAEGEFLTQRRREPPVLLLDDVLSELDEHRRSLVLDEARHYPQTLLTTANLDLLPAWCLSQAHCSQVANGEVTRDR